MSSLAFQFWLHHGPTTFSPSKGLYSTGGSRHAIKLTRWIFRMLGLESEVKRLCAAPTLAEQREIWQTSIRRIILSQTLSRAILSNEKWMWKALGVPAEQRDMITFDYAKQDDTYHGDSVLATQHQRSGRAIWEYVVNTLDPVVNTTLINDDNHYYGLCLRGHYTRRAHPEYCCPRAHIKLSAPAAFDGLRIHTDELVEALDRMAPASLSIAVVMDSMDWFVPGGEAANRQIRALNRALRVRGRVLVRSAGLSPWYVGCFEEGGFACKRVAARLPGTCTDRCVGVFFLLSSPSSGFSGPLPGLPFFPFSFHSEVASCWFSTLVGGEYADSRCVCSQGEHVCVDLDLHQGCSARGGAAPSANRANG